MICLDANVFVSATLTGEKFCEPSRLFMRAAEVDRLSVCAPSLLLAEIAGAISRRSTRENGRVLTRLARRFPGLVLVPLDETLVLRAAKLAVTLQLRGADACYVAVARHEDATLVT